MFPISLLITAIIMASSFLKKNSIPNDKNGKYQPIVISSPSNGAKVNLLEGGIYEFAYDYVKFKSKDYLSSDYPAGYSPNGKQRADEYSPKPVTITWDSEDGAEYYSIKVSTKKDLSKAESYVTFDKSLELLDLFVDTTYYYQIIANFSNKEIKSQIFTFTTANLIRTIDIEGVSNTRDIGGRFTLGGSRIRQGMVYRGARLDDITEKGKEKALKTYGIKTDLDLRAEKTESPLGKGVNFVNVSGPYYVGFYGVDSILDGSNGIWQGTYREALIKEIKTFAESKNYPIYVHCAIGRDRTGTIIFLINALCGVDEKDLYMDYETSFFSTSGCLDGQTPQTMVGGPFTNLVDYMKNYGNGSLSQNVEKFMLDIGILKEEIDAIRSIMIEEIE